MGAASTRLYVSYPRIELSESRARVPSFYALDVVRANAALRSIAGEGRRLRDFTIATGLVGDARYLPWLIERMDDDTVLVMFSRADGKVLCWIAGLGCRNDSLRGGSGY